MNENDQFSFVNCVKFLLIRLFFIVTSEFSKNSRKREKSCKTHKLLVLRILDNRLCTVKEKRVGGNTCHLGSKNEEILV